MSTRRRLPRAPSSSFASVVLAESEVLYDQTGKRFRMGDGVTLGGKPMALLEDTAATLTPFPGFYGQISGGTNPGNSYELTIDGAILVRPEDGALMRVKNFNDYCYIGQSRSVAGGIRGRDTATALSAYEMGYVWMCGNQSTGYACLTASTAESHLNVARPAGYDFIVPYPAAAYLADTGSNVRNMLIYGRRHRYVKTNDGNTMPIIASGATGNPTTGVYTLVSVGGFVPVQAHTVTFTQYGYNGLSKLAPDGDYDTGGGGGIGLPYVVETSNKQASLQADIMLEDYHPRQVAYCSNDAGGALGIYGFELSYGTVGG